MDELKPCPFCGSDYIKVDRMRFGMRAWCPECLAHGPTTQVAPGGTAQSAWNDLRSAEDDLRARAEAAEQRAEAAEAALAAAQAEVEQVRATDGHAAAFFCQSVAHLLAPPGAEDDAVRHLRADDLPDLLTHLRERLAQARADGEAAGAARERERVLALVRAAYDALKEASFVGWFGPSAASSALDALELRIKA